MTAWDERWAQLPGLAGLGKCVPCCWCGCKQNQRPERLVDVNMYCSITDNETLGIFDDQRTNAQIGSRDRSSAEAGSSHNALVRVETEAEQLEGRIVARTAFQGTDRPHLNGSVRRAVGWRMRTDLTSEQHAGATFTATPWECCKRASVRRPCTVVVWFTVCFNIVWLF